MAADLFHYAADIFDARHISLLLSAAYEYYFLSRLFHYWRFFIFAITLTLPSLLIAITPYYASDAFDAIITLKAITLHFLFTAFSSPDADALSPLPLIAVYFRRWLSLIISPFIFIDDTPCCY